MILLSLALAAVQAPAAPDERARACQALVRSAPQQALVTAQAWIDEDGGFPARQCLGLAYAALEQWVEAGTVFENAARAAETAVSAGRADFWVQAGNAWLAAGDADRALRAFDAALLVAGLTDARRGAVHLDRARARVAKNELGPARGEIDRALQLAPADPIAWYLSAALAGREGDRARALSDIARAKELAPDNPDILLLAGTIAGQAGDMEEAERLYRRAAELAPESEAGRQARASLATLREVEVPAPAQPAPPPQPQSR